MTKKIFNKKYSKKFATGLLMFVILSSSFLPIFSRKAEAQWITWDPGNFVPNAISSVADWSDFLKEYALDAVAVQAANMIAERVTASTVNWINSGFKGSPAYVQDPQAYFKDLGDKVAGDFINNDPRLSSLCGPISARVRLALTSNYIGENRQWQCTLSEVTGNLEDFMGDFSQGGWDNFFEVTQRDQNNPIGAYLQAQNELSLQLNSRAENSKMQLGWGTGFLSKKTCARYSEAVAGGTVTGERQLIGIGADGEEIYGEEINQALPDIPPKCLEEKIVTPGSVIEDQLNDVLGLGNSKLAVADEINEIVSALLGQMLNRVVGGIGGGLFGASASSNTGGSSFTDTLNQKSNAAAQEAESSCDPAVKFCGYFGEDLDNATETLNTPPPDPTSGISGNETLVAPEDVAGLLGGGSSRPIDPDCAAYSDSELNQMANEVSSSQGISYAEAYRNLDCQPR